MSECCCLIWLDSVVRCEGLIFGVQELEATQPSLEYVAASHEAIGTLCMGQAEDNKIQLLPVCQYATVVDNLLAVHNSPHMPSFSEDSCEPEDNERAATNDTIGTVFDRYDLDGSGTINSRQEMLQLTINALVKLGVPVGDINAVTDIVDNTVNELTKDGQGISWSIEEYQEWYHDQLIPTLPGIPTEPSVPNIVNVSSVVSTSLERLYSFKLAQLRHFVSVFVDTTSQACLMPLHRFDSRLWPKHGEVKDWERAAPPTIIEMVVVDLERLQTVDPRNAHAAVLQKYVFEGVVPLLEHLFGPRHFPLERQTPVQASFVEWLQDYLRGLTFGGNKKLLVCYRRTRDAFLHRLGHGGAPMEQTESDIASHSLIQLQGQGSLLQRSFKGSWRNYCEAFACVVGIVDLDRMLGVGVKNMGRFLSRDSCHAAVAALYKIMVDGPGMDKIMVGGLPVETLAALIRVCRAGVYFDPNFVDSKEAIEENWEAFQNDEPPLINEESLGWCQNKLIQFGAVAVVIKVASHPGESVRKSALRFGMSLLKPFQRSTQQAFLDHFRQEDTTEFFHTICNVFTKVERCISLIYIEGDKSDVHKYAWKHARKECTLVLKFLQALVCRHCYPFKHLMREQLGTNKQNYNIILELGRLVAQASRCSVLR